MIINTHVKLTLCLTMALHFHLIFANLEWVTGSPILKVKNLRWDKFSDFHKATSWDLNENSSPTVPASPPHTDCPLDGDHRCQCLVNFREMFSRYLLFVSQKINSHQVDSGEKKQF